LAKRNKKLKTPATNQGPTDYSALAELQLLLLPGLIPSAANLNHLYIFKLPKPPPAHHLCGGVINQEQELTLYKEQQEKEHK